MTSTTRRFLWINSAFLLLRLLLAAVLPLSPDEAYYFQWAQHPALGYFDHPPMIAWWMAASTAIFGDSPLALRAFAPLSFALIAQRLFLWMRRMAGERQALWVVTALNVAPLFNLGGVILTPDTPLLVFWSLALLAAVDINERARLLDFVRLGVYLALGLLSKYSMALFVPCLLFALSWTTIHKHRFKLALAGIVTLAIITPHLNWLLAHDWISLRFQFDHGFSGAGRWWENLGGFVLAQVVLFTPGFWWLFIRASRERLSQPHWLRTLLPFAWIPILLFTPIALFSHAEAGWAAVAYPAALVVAAAFASHPSIQLAARQTVWLAAGFTLLLYLWGLGVFGGNNVLRQAHDLQQEGQTALELLPESALELPVFARDYQLASLWAYNFPEKKLPGVAAEVERRKSQYDLWQQPEPSRGFIWVARQNVTGPPKLAQRLPLHCQYLDESHPQRLTHGRYVFLICLPENESDINEVP